MVSTGEVACFGRSSEEAFLKALVASGYRIPMKGDSILLTVGGRKECIIDTAKKLSMQGFRIYATEHTAEALIKNGVNCETLHKVSEKKQPNIMDYLMNQKIKLVISVSKFEGPNALQASDDDYVIRRKTVEFVIPIMTNLELADTLIGAIHKIESKNFDL